MLASFSLTISLLAVLTTAFESGRLLTIPTTPFTYSPRRGSLSLYELRNLVVDSRYALATDQNGLTLLPPTLFEFAQLFREDLETVLGLSLDLSQSQHKSAKSIFLTLEKDASTFSDVAGHPSAEGYRITVSDHGILVAGASPLGVWWGTRTVLQQAVLNDMKFPYGMAKDTPGWASRGVMLDAARKFYPSSFIIEMCSLLSFFKQNVLHLHLSDNPFMNHDRHSPEDAMSLYGAFRLWSEDPAVTGLSKMRNESYTQQEYQHLQAQCAQRGVTVIPEIEAPAHALPIIRWKPELGLRHDPTMLNLSHPGTIPAVKTIWQTFLPWFQSKVVHIGADEYPQALAQDYTRFVDEMNAFIRLESGKSIRIWGTFPPDMGGNVSKEVTVQHWAFYADNPWPDFIMNGYNVLNSDFASYVVPKWSPVFQQSLNKTLIFHGNPSGGQFSPNVLDPRIAANNPPRSEPAIAGHVAPMWNDWGPTASTHLEAYHSWRGLLPALADKQWGGDLLEREYEAVFGRLLAAVPAQNLDRSIPTKAGIILRYLFNEIDPSSSQIRDASGNEYHGTNHGCEVGGGIINFNGDCYLETPLLSKGRNYTLSFWVYPQSTAPSRLFAGPDSVLKLGEAESNNVTMVSLGHPYSLNYSLPTNAWTRAKLEGIGDRTFFSVSSGYGGEKNKMEFITRIDTEGVQAARAIPHAWVPMAFEAPLAKIGEDFKGAMEDVILTEPWG